MTNRAVLSMSTIALASTALALIQPQRAHAETPRQSPTAQLATTHDSLKTTLKTTEQSDQQLTTQLTTLQAEIETAKQVLATATDQLAHTKPVDQAAIDANKREVDDQVAQVQKQTHFVAQINQDELSQDRATIKSPAKEVAAKKTAADKESDATKKEALQHTWLEAFKDLNDRQDAIQHRDEAPQDLQVCKQSLADAQQERQHLQADQKAMTTAKEAVTTAREHLATLTDQLSATQRKQAAVRQRLTTLTTLLAAATPAAQPVPESKPTLKEQQKQPAHDTDQSVDSVTDTAQPIKNETAQQKAAKAMALQTELPQTNERTTGWLGFITGFGLLIIAGVHLMTRRFSRHFNN